MSRYIDAEHLMQKLSRMIDFCEKHKVSGLNALFQVGDAIMDCPTADVVEVRHGEWIFINQAVGYLEPPYGDTAKCSLCEFVVDVSEMGYKYCPNCGAKMDGERKD